MRKNKLLWLFAIMLGIILWVLSQPIFPLFARQSKDNLLKGIYTDPYSGISWMRCSFGQVWDGTTCLGDAKAMTWYDAWQEISTFNQNGGFAGITTWKIPKEPDLGKLVVCSNDFEHEYVTIEGYTTDKGAKRTALIGKNNERRRRGIDISFIWAGRTPNLLNCAEGSTQPTTNTDIFKNTKPIWYWSSDSLKPIYAWGVGFERGMSDYTDKSTLGHVRLIHYPTYYYIKKMLFILFLFSRGSCKNKIKTLIFLICA